MKLRVECKDRNLSVVNVATGKPIAARAVRFSIDLGSKDYCRLEVDVFARVEPEDDAPGRAKALQSYYGHPLMATLVAVGDEVEFSGEASLPLGD